MRDPQHPLALSTALTAKTKAQQQGKGARLAELLDYARLRPPADASLQGRLI